jgi:hypothetical protein
MIDALQRVGRDAQADVAAERVGDEGDVAEVGQEPALGLDVGVAHLVAHLGALGRQFAAPRHRENPLVARISQPLKARRGLKSRSFQEPRTYRQCASTRQELGAMRVAGAAACQKADFAGLPTI